MQKRLLKFPEYEFLKALPRTRWTETLTRDGKIIKSEMYLEYSITLFDTPTEVYGRFSLFEDGDDFICFDVIEDGYCDHNKLGKTYKFNKANYNRICKHAQMVYEQFFKRLEKDLSYQWQGRTPEEFAEIYGN